MKYTCEARNGARKAASTIAGLAIALLLALLISSCGQLSAATWYVKTTGSDSSNGQDWGHAKKTVQAGVNVASSADDVWVAAGTYQERVTLKSGVRLYGGFVGTETDFGLRDPVNNTTTIDANLTGIAVTVPASAISTTTFDGFTVRNGKGTNGAGILCDSREMQSKLTCRTVKTQLLEVIIIQTG